MTKQHGIVTLLICLAGCSISSPITVEELKSFMSQHSISGPVYRGNFALMKELHLADGESIKLPSIVVVNKQRQVVYMDCGYSSSFSRDLRDAIDCNTKFCRLDSTYSHEKYAGKKY